MNMFSSSQSSTVPSADGAYERRTLPTDYTLHQSAVAVDPEFPAMGSRGMRLNIESLAGRRVDWI
jgi:hypothetical protein